MPPSRLKHGHARKAGKSPEYVVWMKMRSRCNNPNVPAYADYGGRGISVCPQWDSFEAFFADMGPRPGLAYSLDRIDNSRGYEPCNCRWATMREQQRNRRDSLVILADGITATLAEHCERTGVKYTTAHMRLQKGASIEVALSPNRPPYGSLSRGKKVTLARLNGQGRLAA